MDSGRVATSSALPRPLKRWPRRCSRDNAVAQRFFWSLKRGWTTFESYVELEPGKLSVFGQFETIVNPVRLRRALSQWSSDHFEQKLSVP